MLTGFLVIVGLCLLYVLAVRCRSGHPGLAELRRFSYAHRGLHSQGVPENSMTAFRMALEKGYGVELDVHLLRDGTLAVIHDSSLLRTAGADVLVEDLTLQELGNYRLEGTDEQIPLFSQVLELYAGKAPLIVELKPLRGNHSALSEAVCNMLADYPGAYCMESFDPRCVYWLKKHAPKIIRGQLAQNNFRSKSKHPWILRLVMTHHLLNFLTVPDFVAYRFEHRGTTPSNWLCRKLWHAQGVGWTLQTPEEQQKAKEEGWISIFENFLPEP